MTAGKPSPRIVFSRLAWAAMALFVAWYVFDRGKTAPPRPVAYSEFLAAVDQGRVTDVRLTERELTATLAKPGPDGETRIATTRLPAIDESQLVACLERHQVKFSGTLSASSAWVYLLGSLLPLAVVAAIWIVATRRLRKTPVMTFGRNRAKVHDRSREQQVTFADVAGVDEAEAELAEVIDFLRNPGRYGRLGGRMPKGVLLVGPPGTGKTLLARAVAGESRVPFFSISGSEFVEMFVGVGAARVRDLFEQARENAPCIVFIDELDAVGRSRMAVRGALLANDEREQTLNQLLAEMDGFDSSNGVIIMAATNAPEVLDPALLRAGRFDRQIVVDRPDVAGRDAILRVHARGKTLASDVRLEIIAARTPGMAGADLANIVNEAALLAARRDAAAIEMRDCEEAIDRVTLGLQRRSRLMTADEKERVAHHEAGHAIVALSVPHAERVHRISIVPRSTGALGHVLQLPTEERFLMTKPQIEDQLAVMMAGRAAEELAFDGVVSTGAADDFEKATALARMMITRFGMNEEAGVVAWESPSSRFLESPFFAARGEHSEETARTIDAACRSTLAAALDRAASILTRRRSDLSLTAKKLIERETLSRDELDLLLQAKAAS
ncbi:MAG TPA: ATP-dependent zinc metalloprotease FtsH [Thermoanaerobaculia bacterium]